jgi:hypothetical protein
MRLSRWCGLLLALSLCCSSSLVQSEPTGSEILTVLEMVSTELSRASERQTEISDKLRIVSTELQTASTALSTVRMQQLPDLEQQMLAFVTSFNDYVTRTTSEMRRLEIQSYVVGGIAVVVAILALVLP